MIYLLVNLWLIFLICVMAYLCYKQWKLIQRQKSFLGDSKERDAV